MLMISFLVLDQTIQRLNSLNLKRDFLANSTRDTSASTCTMDREASASNYTNNPWLVSSSDDNSKRPKLDQSWLSSSSGFCDQEEVTSDQVTKKSDQVTSWLVQYLADAMEEEVVEDDDESSIAILESPDDYDMVNDDVTDIDDDDVSSCGKVDLGFWLV